MKRVHTNTRTETNTEECVLPAAPVNPFHARAMKLIEEQLPVAIAIGRDMNAQAMLRTLHLIAGGSTLEGLNGPSNGPCVGSGNKY